MTEDGQHNESQQALPCRTSKDSQNVMTKYDRPGTIQNPRTTWDASPAQRGSSLPELPSVPEEIDWSDYEAYQCRSCQDDCINRRNGIPAESRLCWTCLRFSPPGDPSYIEAIVELRVEREVSKRLSEEEAQSADVRQIRGSSS